jgi:hypothetical protein
MSVKSVQFSVAAHILAVLGFRPGEDVSSKILAGRVEDWRRCSVGPAYPLLPVSGGSASLARP